MQSEPKLVTGDAVVLELPTATIGSRGAALMLDVLVELLVFTLGLLLASLVIFEHESDPSLWLGIILLPMLILTRVVYPVVMETFGGRTLGKMALGLRVVREDGGPISFRHAVARGLAGAIVDFGPVYLWGIIGVTASLTSAKSQRLGDRLAGTIVIRDRTPSAKTVEPALAPELREWASRLDLSHVDDQLALSIRQYVQRQGQLRPQARHSLGSSLVRDALDESGREAVADVDPSAVLAAVLAERRRRAQS